MDTYKLRLNFLITTIVLLAFFATGCGLEGGIPGAIYNHWNNNSTDNTIVQGKPIVLPAIEDVKKEIASKSADWVPTETSVTQAIKTGQANATTLLGATQPELPTASSLENQPNLAPSNQISLPTTFTWLNKDNNNWLTSIKDQGQFGTCVSFASIGALETQLRIKNNRSSLTLDYSELHLFSMGGDFQNGWSYWKPDGSGSLQRLKDFGTVNENECTYSNVPNHITTICQNAVKKRTWSHYYYYDGNVSNEINLIKQNILNGPILVYMKVYVDFYYYKTGVYQHVFGDPSGYHAILLIGYDDAKQCYIARNSWSTGWGENGYFNIKYGQCEMEYYGAYQIICNDPPIASNISVPNGVLSGNILVNYSTADANNDTCSVKLYYSTDDGLNYTLAKEVNGNNNYYLGNKTLTWNSVTDFANDQIKVKIKIVPNDGRDDGTYAESKTLHVNNMPKTLMNITLSKTIDNAIANSAYNLSTIKTIANYSDNTTAEVASTWSVNLTSISGTIYNVPATGAQILTASYTYRNTTKTANLTINIRSLSSISLSKISDIAIANSTYDLSTIKAIANYSDNTTAEVTPVWSANSVTISGTSYNVPASGASTLIASFTQSGITKTTNFTLNIKSLSKLAINKTSDTVIATQTYNLSGIQATVTYSDNTTQNVIAVWYDQNNQVIANSSYTASTTAGPVTLIAKYIAGGSMVSASFVLNVKKINGLTLSITQDTLEVTTQYSLANVKTTVFYTDNTSKEVTVTWAASPGSISNNNYIPTAKGNATLTATYVETGTTLTSTLKLSVISSLSALSISKTADTIETLALYDLTKIKTIAQYLDKTTAEVSAKWTADKGTINGTNYTAPATAGTATLTASYTENKITKTSGLSLVINQTLTSITLSKATDNTIATGRYDLTQIKAIASYADNTSKEVTITSWKDNNGNTIQTPYSVPYMSGNLAITATYIENGIAKTSNLTLNVTIPPAAPTLASITLSKNTDNVPAGSYYDLSKITATGTMSDGSTLNNVTLTWTAPNGSGSISGTNYISPSSVGDVNLTALYTKDGVQKQTILKLSMKVPTNYINSQENWKNFRGFDLMNHVWKTLPASNGNKYAMIRSSYVGNVLIKLNNNFEITNYYFDINPEDFSLDSNDNIYITKDNKIYKYDSNLNLISNFGSFSTSPISVRYIRIKKDLIYTWELANDPIICSYIYKYDLQGHFIERISLLQESIGFTLDGNDNIITASCSDGGSIIFYDNHGNFIKKVSNLGWNGGRIGITCTNEGKIFFNDCTKFFVYDNNGNKIKELNFGSLESQIPLSCDNNFVYYGFGSTLYLLDVNSYSTQSYDLGFTQKGHLNNPWGLGVDINDNIYVADTMIPRIQKFDINGNFLSQFTVQDPALLCNIVIDTNGNVYTATGDIIKYDSAGNFISKWLIGADASGGMGLTIDKYNNIYVGYNNKIVKYDSNGNILISKDTIINCRGLQIDNDNNLYVLEASKVTKLNSNFETIKSWGSNTGLFTDTYSIAMNNSNQILVLELDGRIYIFDLDGNYINQVSTTMADDVDANTAVGIRSDKHGNIYTIDLSAARVKKFIPSY